MVGMAGMVKQQKEWQNGRMAEMDTYILFMVHADTDDDNDDDTSIFYSIEFLSHLSTMPEFFFAYAEKSLQTV